MVSNLKTVIYTVLFLLPSFVISQNDTIKFWVQFTDKDNSKYSINNPKEYLSDRAIIRRNMQNISITENDIPVNKKYIDSILKLGNFNLKNQSKWFNAITVSTDDSSNINLINNISFVKQIQNVQRLSIIKELEGSVEYTKMELSISNIENYPYGNTFNQIDIHKAQRLHELGLIGQGIHISVIDAGFFQVDKMKGLEHLFDENRILSTKDFVDNEENVYEDHHHGAIVLSIIAGNIPGIYYGTAPKASFHLLRTEDSNIELILEEDNWIAAAEYSDSAGVDIINTSLGYTKFDDTLQNHTYLDMNGNTTRIAIASDIAASKGILLITSAGNEGASNWKYISTPADADSVVAVAAINEEGERAVFSSVGPSSDGDVKPNVASVGWDTYYISPMYNSIERGNGTSFSAPMITGMAACLWQGLPSYSNMDIKQLIEESSSQYNSPDSLIGYGIPNFYKAYNKATGVSYSYPRSGIINLYPNPFENDVKLMLNSSSNQKITIDIKDCLGRNIRTIDQDIYVGKNITTLGFTGDWKAGFYLLNVFFEDGSQEKFKIIKR